MATKIAPVTARDRAWRGQSTTAAVVAVQASLLAAAVHLVVVPEHLTEWWVFAAFFVTVAAGQVLTAAAVLWRPLPAYLAMALGGNVLVIVVWVVSRTVGLPVGPPVTDMTAGLGDPGRGGYGAHAVGVPEPAGVLDVGASVLELVTVVALLVLLPAAYRRRAVDMLFGCGVLVWLLGLVWVLG